MNCVPRKLWRGTVYSPWAQVLHCGSGEAMTSRRMTVHNLLAPGDMDGNTIEYNQETGIERLRLDREF